MSPLSYAAKEIIPCRGRHRCDHHAGFLVAPGPCIGTKPCPPFWVPPVAYQEIDTSPRKGISDLRLPLVREERAWHKDEGDLAPLECLIDRAQSGERLAATGDTEERLVLKSDTWSGYFSIASA